MRNKKVYSPPMVSVAGIEIETSIMTGSGSGGGATIPTVPGGEATDEWEFLTRKRDRNAVPNGGENEADATDTWNNGLW